MPARLALGAVLLAGLAACATAPSPKVSPQEYAAMQTVLRDSAEARQELQGVCTANIAGKSPREREMIAAFLDVDPGNLDRVFCERVIAGIARKDITYEDFLSMSAERMEPATMRRFMRALRRDPSEVMV